MIILLSLNLDSALFWGNMAMMPGAMLGKRMVSCFTAGHEILVETALVGLISQQKLTTSGISYPKHLPNWLKTSLLAAGSVATLALALTPKEKRKLLLATHLGTAGGQLDPDFWDSSPP